MDLQDHHLAVVPVFTIRVILYDFLKTVERFLVVFLRVFGISIDNPHLEENAVLDRRIVGNKLLIFTQGRPVVSLVEKLVGLLREGSFIDVTASADKNGG